MTSFHLLPELSPKEHVDNIADTIEIVSNELEDIVPMANDYIIKNCCNKPNTFNCYYNNPSKPVAFVKLLRKDEREFDILLKLSELKLSEKPLNSGLIYYKTYPNIKDGIVGDEVRQSWESTSTVSRSSENNFRVRHLNYVAVIMPWAVDCNQKVIKNFVGNFNDAFIGLTGTKDEIDKVIKSFKIYVNYNKKNLLHIVITGLGNKSDGDGFFTGKIRKQFPLWLETNTFKNLVKSYSPCKIQHGGLGAFYVKLRVKE